MSYYILPKKKYIIDINPIYRDQDQPCQCPYVSQTLYSYLHDSLKLIQLDNDELSLLYKMVNPYEFIFSIVPEYKSSISKLNPSSNTFYILMELIATFNLLGTFNYNIKTAYIGNPIECLNMFRAEFNDINYNDDSYATPNNINAIDFFYFDVEMDKLIFILIHILTYQSSDGTCIIKIDGLFNKLVLDILFILCGLYDKVYIIKPNTSNIISNDRYIVCKQFNLNSSLKSQYETYNNKLVLAINSSCIISLFNCDLPVYFLNKIADSNIIIGHQQIESIDHILSIFKSKHKNDKIEALKKNNIQKCIQWCEKYKIPYNTITRKINIFLKNRDIKEAEEAVIIENVVMVTGDDDIVAVNGTNIPRYFMACPPGLEAETPLFATVGPADKLPELVTDFEK